MSSVINLWGAFKRYTLMPGQTFEVFDLIGLGLGLFSKLPQLTLMCSRIVLRLCHRRLLGAPHTSPSEGLGWSLSQYF
jgi:hypothetical protein